MNRSRFEIITIGLIIGVLAVILLPGCVVKPEDTLVKRQSKPIVESKLDQKIIQLVTETYIPYQYEENGVITGFAVDVVQEAFRRHGYAVELSIRPWTRALQMVEDGDTDGIFLAFYNEERAVFMQYLSEPIDAEALYIYTLKDSPLRFSGDMAQLEGYNIGVLQDWYYGEHYDQAVKEGRLTVQPVTDVTVNIQKLMDGRIDALLNPRLSTLYYLKAMGLQDRIIEQPGVFREPAGLYLAFTKKRFVSQELIRLIDEELQNMKADGTYQEIMERYTK